MIDKYGGYMQDENDALISDLDNLKTYFPFFLQPLTFTSSFCVSRQCMKKEQLKEANTRRFAIIL